MYRMSILFCCYMLYLITSFKLLGSEFMKKVVNILAATALAGTLLLSSGCGSVKNEKSLYAQGVKVITLMKEMTQNEDYLNASAGSAVLKSRLSDAAAEEIGKPKTVYQISIKENDLIQMLEAEEIKTASEELRGFITSASYAAVASQINAAGGPEDLAAAAACKASETFISTNFTGNVLYLYLYENGAPVMVSFTSGPEHIVTATGTFILTDEFAPESKEEVASYFGTLPVEVTEVQP